MATKVIGPTSNEKIGQQEAHGWSNGFDSQMGAPGKSIDNASKSGTPKTDHTGPKNG